MLKALLKHHVSGAIERGEGVAIVGITISDRDMQNRADRLACNPHNMPGIPGSPPMTNHAYWAARFEHEGREAKRDTPNPYNAGTMAATRWQSGFDSAALIKSIRTA